MQCEGRLCICHAVQEGGLVVMPSAVNILDAEVAAKAAAGGFCGAEKASGNM